MRSTEIEEYLSSELRCGNKKPKHSFCESKIFTIMLFILLIITILLIFIYQYIKINNLNNEIDDLKNSFAEEIPYLKNNTSYLSQLNDKINKTEIDLLEKEIEINTIKKNLHQKDEEAVLINQKINNITSLLDENINNIKEDLSHKDEKIELIKKNTDYLIDSDSNIYENINNIIEYLNHNDIQIESLRKDSDDLSNSNLILVKSINNIAKELEQSNEEIEKHSNNINILNDKLNNIEVTSNKNSDEIQNIKNIESNLSLLVDFKIKVRIKANFNIEDQQAYLCSHKPFDIDVIDDSRVRLNAFKWNFGGCVWILHQNGKYFEFFLTDSSYEMNNWKIRVSNNEVFTTNTEKDSIFILEESSLNRYYKIKDNETGEYLFINQEKKRDDSSYFVDLTTDKDLATDFYFEIYHEE